MSYSQLNNIMLKLTDEITVKVLNLLLDRKEIIDEEMVNILNEEIERLYKVSQGDEIEETKQPDEVSQGDEIEEIKQPDEVSQGDEIEEIPRIALKEVRKSLYKLNERSLARYRRIRDRETGYFVYYWSPIYERILDLIISRRKQSIKKLRQRLDYEQRNLLYVCDEGHTPVPFSDAFELGFICTTCGKELSQKDNTKTIQFLEKKIEELNKELKTGLEELDDIAELVDKQSSKK